jgi:hypothetical protein
VAGEHKKKFNLRLALILSLILSLILNLNFVVAPTLPVFDTVQVGNLRNLPGIYLSYPYYLNVSNTGGNFSGSGFTVYGSDRYGLLTYTALADHNFTLNFDPTTDRPRVVLEGFSASVVDLWEYTGEVNTNDLVLIRWEGFRPGVIDLYFILGIGISGISMIIAGLVFMALLITGGFKGDNLNYLAISFVLVILGFGLTVVWLTN